MGGQFKIMIADGSRHVREYFLRVLGEHGYGVVQARDHREVFELLNSDTPPDLVILDLNIPYTGGLDVLLRLRRLVPPSPVIVCSILTEYEHHPVVETADAFVEKEGNPEAMLRAIPEVLKKYYPGRVSGAPDGEGHITPARLLT